MRGAVAVVAAAFLSACSNSSLGSSSGTTVCAPQAFRCDGYTPGFWTNVNGCRQLTEHPWLVDELNGLLGGVCQDPVETCADLDPLLKVSGEDKSLKLLAMYAAFSLNQWRYWKDDCFDGPIDFKWRPELWIPGDASQACVYRVKSWFDEGPVTFADLSGLAETLLQIGFACNADSLEFDPETIDCEAETLKNFFDAANNDASVCLCKCPTGASGGTGGNGGYE